VSRAPEEESRDASAKWSTMPVANKAIDTTKMSLELRSLASSAGLKRAIATTNIPIGT
jgi:hypothetical protein